MRSLTELVGLVIVDALPLTDGPDTAALAAHCDAVLVVVAARDLERDAVRAELRRLREAGVRVIGAAITNASTRMVAAHLATSEAGAGVPPEAGNTAPPEADLRRSAGDCRALARLVPRYQWRRLRTRGRRIATTTTSAAVPSAAVTSAAITSATTPSAAVPTTTNAADGAITRHGRQDSTAAHAEPARPA